jgi:hypothetical protein
MELEDWPSKIEGETAWDGKTLEAQTEKWIYEFSGDDIAECDAAIKNFDSLQKDVLALTKDDFPLPNLSQVLAKYKVLISILSLLFVVVFYLSINLSL